MTWENRQRAVNIIFVALAAWALIPIWGWRVFAGVVCLLSWMRPSPPPRV